MKLGFIGTGVITEAIITGLFDTDLPISDVTVSVRGRTISARLAENFPLVRVSQDNQEIVDESDVIFLAVRPQDAEAVVSPLQFGAGQQVASLIATLPIETLQKWIGPSAKIARAIPLPSVSDKQGVTAIYPSSEILAELFAPLGTVVTAKTLEEFDALAVASAIMGTYFGIMETTAQWLQGKGTNYDNAKLYLNGVFLGLANTASQSEGLTYDELRLDHSTPNGINQQLFDVFTYSGGCDALLEAFESVSDRIQLEH